MQIFQLPTGPESGKKLHSGNRLSLFSLHSSSLVIMFLLSVNFEDPKSFFSDDMGVFLHLSLLILCSDMTYSSIHLDISQEIVLDNEISDLN